VAISINEVSSGIGLKVDNNIYVVVDFQHVKPGKGSAFVRIKMKNMRNQNVIERTYKTADQLEDIDLDERKLQHTYHTGSEYHFMDQTTFEEVTIPEEVIGNGVKFLQEQMDVVGYFYQNEALKVELPMFIISEIAHTEPGIKGDSSKSGTKPATIDTGAVIQVPLFVEVGDKVKLDTRDGAYVERVKK
jgi:elongation factor P